MYSAPAVSYPVGRSTFHGRLLVAILMIGVATLITWGWFSDAIGPRHLVALGLWVVSAVVAVAAWRRSPTGWLSWDGQNWTWTCDDVTHVVVLRVTLDIQAAMLLHLCKPDASGLWVWLERRSAPVRWLPCRRAVFAPQPLGKGVDAGWVAP